MPVQSPYCLVENWTRHAYMRLFLRVRPEYKPRYLALSGVAVVFFDKEISESPRGSNLRPSSPPMSAAARPAVTSGGSGAAVQPPRSGVRTRAFPIGSASAQAPAA